MGEDGWRQRDGTAGCTDGWLCSAHGYFSFLLWSRIALETICNTHFMSPSLASALSYCSAVSEKTYGLVSVAASTRHVLLFAANTVSSEQPSILTIIYINNKMKPHINSLGLKNLNWLFIFWHSSVGLSLQRPVLHKSVQRPAVKASAVGRYIPDQLRSSVWNRVLGVLMKAIGWVTIPGVKGSMLAFSWFYTCRQSRKSREDSSNYFLQLQCRKEQKEAMFNF